VRRELRARLRPSQLLPWAIGRSSTAAEAFVQRTS
jgi:hypothetical protein